MSSSFIFNRLRELFLQFGFGLPRRCQPESLRNLSTFVVESLFFLARYFSAVSFGLLSMRVGRHFQKHRTPESFLVPALPG